jgi:paraquat-inducible protein B
VEVSAKIAKEAAGLMTEGASFWIVRPRITLNEVSGLGTLLSGNYIGFDRGRSSEERRHFLGLEAARVISPGTPGRQFTLHSTDAEHIDVGLPVYYRGLQVGQVTAYDLAPDGRAVDLQVFVNSPYDTYVHPTTRFWNASGLDVSLGTGGVNLRTESLVSLLVGGLAFDDGPISVNESAAAEGAAFTLYRDRATAMKQLDPNARRYVLYFDESLQGVAPGTPVTFLGIPAGEVTTVGIANDRETRRMRGRLEITFSPERLIERLPAAQVAEAREVDRNDAKRNAFLRQLIVRDGLRAQLRTASLVTGQRYVAFEYFSHSPVARLNWDQAPLELPVVPGVLPAFEEKLTALLEKLDALPLGQMAGDMRDLMREARMTLTSMNGLARDVDEKALPQFVAAVEQARSALNAAERMVDGASTTLVGPEAPGQRELRSALQEMTRAARSLRLLSDSIERHPESLLRGRSAEANPQ